MEVQDLILAELKALGSKQDDVSGKLDAYMVATEKRLTWVETQMGLRVGNGQPGLCAQHVTIMNELDARITTLEDWKAGVLGAAAAVGALFGLCFHYVIEWFKHK